MERHTKLRLPYTVKAALQHIKRKHFEEHRCKEDIYSKPRISQSQRPLALHPQALYSFKGYNG